MFCRNTNSIPNLPAELIAIFNLSQHGFTCLESMPIDIASGFNEFGGSKRRRGTKSVQKGVSAPLTY
jgi:hypothetical protein